MNTETIFERLHKEMDIYQDAYPAGISTPEVADKLGVTRQTVHRDLSRLESLQIPLTEVSHQRYAIHPDFGRRIQLSLAQAWFLYLPLRRMVRSGLQRYPFVRGLLHRISKILNPTLAEQLTGQLDDTESEQDDIFTNLTTAWRKKHLIEVRYKPLNETPRRHLIAPYWFEPAVWSDSIYLIAGLVQHNGTLTSVTLKVDRILSTIPRTELFEAPPTEHILQDIQRTWGIWNAEDVTHVVLRFNNQVQERLRETHWHPTQKITEQDDGSVLWEGYIAEPQEMMSWIRSWGADVEVIQPEKIREQITLDTKLMAQLYGIYDAEEGYF